MTQAILAAAYDAGAVAAAFAPCESVDAAAVDYFDRWLLSGRHAGMDYMTRYGDIRRNPELLLQGAQSILCCAFSYNQGAQGRSSLFSDYAVGDDYHDVLRRRLEPVTAFMQELVPGSQTRICIDSAPLRERYYAARAGLGFIGRNCQLIVPEYGSKVFLAEILWTAEADYDQPLNMDCGSCDACVRACPGDALDGDCSLDSRRCLSYLTIEHRGELPIGTVLPGRIYGCDICQDVCPYNRDAQNEILAEFRPRPALMALTRSDIAAMTQEQFSSIFRGSAVKRAKLAGLQRNALTDKS